MIARHGLLARSWARPSLAVTPNHGVRARDRLSFSGLLPGPYCADRIVKVQARLGKHRWQVFRTDRSDASCAFSARYRLRSTANAKRYRFRALVPQAAGYPYQRGTLAHGQGQASAASRSARRALMSSSCSEIQTPGRARGRSRAGASREGGAPRIHGQRA